MRAQQNLQEQLGSPGQAVPGSVEGLRRLPGHGGSSVTRARPAGRREAGEAAPRPTWPGAAAGLGRMGRADSPATLRTAGTGPQEHVQSPRGKPFLGSSRPGGEPRRSGDDLTKDAQSPQHGAGWTGSQLLRTQALAELRGLDGDLTPSQHALRLAPGMPSWFRSSFPSKCREGRSVMPGTYQFKGHKPGGPGWLSG